MKLNLTKYRRNTGSVYLKTFFVIDKFGKEFYQVVGGPLIEVDPNTSRHDHIHLPAVEEFCNTIVDGIKNETIRIPYHIMTDFIRFDKADGKIMCSDGEIGTICFGRVFSYHSYDFFGDVDKDNAFRFNGYRVGLTSSQSWRIEHCADHIIYGHIATVPDTEDINTILDLIITNMNYYPD